MKQTLFTLRNPSLMNDAEFATLLEDYRAIELGVGRLMQAECAPFCSVCPTPCCRTAICREASESPFLLAVHGNRTAFDPKNGYLSATGCKLGVGRPPICHAFICNRIMSQQPDDERRHALDVLGELIGYIGKKVWLRRQLVEALSDADLRKADAGLFRQRLANAAAVLTLLEGYLGGSQALEASGRALLESVKKRPRD
jgi:hypothetical protein